MMQSRCGRLSVWQRRVCSASHLMPVAASPSRRVKKHILKKMYRVGPEIPDTLHAFHI